MDKYLEEKGCKTKIEFPKKFMLFSFDVYSINERMKGLEKYLNCLSRQINFLDYPESEDFLKIEPSVKVLLSSLEYELKNDPWNEQPSEAKKDQPKGIRLINDFLELLKSQPLTITKTVRNFEQMYFETRPIFSKDEIEQFLWGTDKLHGLLHYCGNLENSIGARACMNFFGKLLRYEYASMETEKFLNAFKSTNPFVIKQMQLNHYIRNSMSNDNPGLLALFYFLKYNIFNINNSDEILMDKEAIKIYETWIQGKIQRGYLFKQHLKRPVTRDIRIDSKSTYEDEKEDLTLIATKSLNETKITPSLIELSKSVAHDKIETIISQLDIYTNWEQLGSSGNEAEGTPFFLKGYKYDSQTFRLKISFPTNSTEKVWTRLNDPDKHKAWQDIKRTVITKENNSEVIQSIYASQEAQNLIEYVLVREIEKANDSSCILMKEYSLILPQAFMEDIKRLYINASVSQIRLKSDANGKSYVEYQGIWSIDEGYSCLPEYQIYGKKLLLKELENCTNILY